MSDLERRIRDLERRAPSLLARMDRAGLKLDGTREILRSQILVGGDRWPGVSARIPVDCCSGIDLPASLTLLLPDARTLAIVYNSGSGRWEGSIEYSGVPIGNYVGMVGVQCRIGLPYTGTALVDFDFRCANTGGGLAFHLGATTRYGITVLGQAAAIGSGASGGTCRTLVWSFGGSTPGPGGCSPINVKFDASIFGLSSGGGWPVSSGDDFYVYE